MTRPKLIAALATAIVLVTAAAPFAAGRDLYDGPQWPNIVDDEARWPNIPVADTIFPTTPAQPPFSAAPEQPSPPKTRETDPVVTGSAPSKLSAALGTDVTGSTARWSALPPEPVELPFSFEAGLRYWYSLGTMRFGFTNGNPLYGNPTSTLEWKNMTGHTGEVFARLDHKPTGMFVKGMAGLGAITDGRMQDRDYFLEQFKFSDTTSDVKGDLINFASADLGWAWSPMPGSQLGMFAGYLYWREKAVAYGLFCNQTTIVFTGCSDGGVLAVGYDTAVAIYEPTWQALRLGVEGSIAIDDRWSAHGELVGIPFATLQNKDSHLLRQSSADLGPAPNIITDSREGYGFQTDLFIDYAVTSNISVSGGVRYWQLYAYGGDVRFGPAFSSTYSLNSFDQQRFGLLLQVKGKF